MVSLWKKKLHFWKFTKKNYFWFLVTNSIEQIPPSPSTCPNQYFLSSEGTRQLFFDSRCYSHFFSLGTTQKNMWDMYKKMMLFFGNLCPISATFMILLFSKTNCFASKMCLIHLWILIHVNMNILKNTIVVPNFFLFFPFHSQQGKYWVFNQNWCKSLSGVNFWNTNKIDVSNNNRV